MYRYQPTELEMPRSCHQILGVSRGASAEDLALAFVRTGMACHPSNAANESDRAVARRRLREAADAWAVLSGRPIIGGDAADVQAMQAFESALAAHALGMARYGHDADGILQALVAEGCPPVVAWPVAEQASEQAALWRRRRRDPSTGAAPVRAPTPVARMVRRARTRAPADGGHESGEADTSPDIGAPRIWSRLSGALRVLRGLPAEVVDPYAHETAADAAFDDAPPDADIAQRVAATVIDLVLVFVVCGAPVLAFGRGLESSVVVERAALAAMLLGSALYYVFGELVWGCTAGKRLLGLRVETLDGRAPDLQTVLLRHALRTMSWCLGGTGFLVAPFTGRRQALHDLLTQTRVMCIAEAPREAVRILCALPAAVAVLAFVLTRTGV